MNNNTQIDTYVQIDLFDNHITFTPNLTFIENTYCIQELENIKDNSTNKNQFIPNYIKNVVNKISSVKKDEPIDV